MFMEGNWIVMGVQCGGLLYFVTVYISVFGFFYVQQCCVYGM